MSDGDGIPVSLLDLVERPALPDPWQEGENIPWHEPEFSRRMLAEHLSQQHDAASRRLDLIESHAAWIDANMIHDRPARILDIGCGPGLYTSRLARRGHACTGVDISPAAIAHATAEATKQALACRYVLGDARTTSLGDGYDLAMMVYGEFNSLRPADARALVRRLHAALRPGGRLLLEAHTEEAVRRSGNRGTEWSAHRSGLFSDRPHLLLQEHLWNEAARATVHRHYVVDASSGSVRRYSHSHQAYTDAEYRDLLHDCGFVEIHIAPSLTGAPETGDDGLQVIAARRG